jgi:hypothetical protein
MGALTSIGFVSCGMISMMGAGMTSLSGTRKVNKGDRLYDALFNIHLGFECVLSAICAKDEKQFNAPLLSVSQQFPTSPTLPYSNLVQHAIDGTKPDSLSVTFDQTTIPTHATQMTESLSIYETILAPIFVTFVENHSSAIVAKYGNNHSGPQIYNFGRVIRNCLSHGGEIYFTSPKYTAVTWHNLTYSYADNGKRVIGTDLSVGDLIILMFEMSDELDAVGV